MPKTLCPSPLAQPWEEKQCLDQSVENKYPRVTEGREEKARREELCFEAQGDFYFSMLFIYTDLFTQLKVTGHFNVCNVEVIIIIIIIIIIIVIANFYLQLIVHKYSAKQLYIHHII